MKGVMAWGMRRWKLLTAVLVIVLLGWWWLGGEEEVSYITQPATRGDVVRSISASGTLNPVKLVELGTQISGEVIKLYADFNDQVEEGQVLAELDQSVLQRQLDQSTANMASAEASLRLAEANHKRNKELFGQKFIAKADLDQTQQALVSAQAQMKQAEAQMERDKINLGYTVVRAPVSGVVISRNVDEGQTVAASYQTPTLYTIAQDLAQMQIDTSLAEADVGSVKAGMAVTFTVDAFPDKTFEGTVRQVRLNPTTLQNVVTYNVVVDVANKDLTLLPGMTAFVNMVVDSQKNVLRVPTLALGFRPAVSGEKSGARNGESRGERRGEGKMNESSVYILKRGEPVKVAVTPGLSDDRMTAVSSTELKPGMAVITGKRGLGESAANAGGFGGGNRRGGMRM